MSGRKRQTFDKMNRERAVREKRARKAEKKAEKKLAAQGIVPVDGETEVAEDEASEEQPTV